MIVIKKNHINDTKFDTFGKYLFPMNYWCNHLNIPNTIIHDTWLQIYTNEDTVALYRNMIFTKFIHCKDIGCSECLYMLTMVESM